LACALSWTDRRPISQSHDMPLLAVEGLHKSFGGLVAARALNFHVERGEILGLIGPNGSGKTTVSI
jgi:ABC-type branched-subunit amino acid transport system ATPase component